MAVAHRATWLLPRPSYRHSRHRLTNSVCLGVADIQSFVEYTVTSGSGGLNHNKQHAYAKINELLKCPMKSIIVLGTHGSGITLWYADRCGRPRNQAVHGLSNTSPLRDPCVSVLRLDPHRSYEFRLHTNVYYGEALYTAGGIACRGTLVLAGYHTTAQASEMLAISVSAFGILLRRPGLVPGNCGGCCSR